MVAIPAKVNATGKPKTSTPQTEANINVHSRIGKLLNCPGSRQQILEG